MWTRKQVVKGFGFIPSIIILLLSLWGYYCYVINFAALYLLERNTPAACIFIIVSSVVYLLFLACFGRVVFTHPGRPPPSFSVAKETVAEWERESSGNSEALDSRVSEFAGRKVVLLLKKEGGRVRYCDKCQLVKPDRAHHCSICEECVSKFDHHCPWINNCVGWRNYKYFMLFLFYGFCFTFFILATSIPFIVLKVTEDGFEALDLQLMLMLLFSAAFSMALLLFLPMHIRLMLKNLTTLEDMEKKKVPAYQELGYWPFDVGAKANAAQIMGANKWHWFLPVSSLPHDGVNFEVRDHRDIEEGRRLMDEE